MTEAEWLASDNPQQMLAEITSPLASGRKLRLFACACWFLCNLRKQIDASMEDRSYQSIADGNFAHVQPGSIAADPVRFASHWAEPSPLGIGPDQAAKAFLLREVFGNPFQPATIDAAWLTANVRQLAPILADALEDAGCISVDVLSHCRTPGDHVRGCWAVDLAIGEC